MISISHIDHIVLTVRHIPTTLEFYTRVLGMNAIQFGGSRIALKFGNQNIDLHESGKGFEPRSQTPTPGSADMCLITHDAIDQAMDYIRSYKVGIVEGKVRRTGATGELLSFYIRDPDLNLIEISNQL